MGKMGNLQKQLETALSIYFQLDNDERFKAIEMTLILQQTMLREYDGQRQKLIELCSKFRIPTPDAAKTRNKNVRKSDAVNPLPPIKPLQKIKKNESRRT